ncbi:MAG: methionyl-tRNA formyltransferase [Mangrovibacterium sp.]
MLGKDLRIVFMGTPDFAVASLQSLVEEGFQIVGVVTSPDRPAGRGLQLQQSAVKQYAVDQGLYLLQPEKLKDSVFISELEALRADLQIVVAFRMLPEVVWSMPRLGTFNLHGSLLPQYRGAAPLNWAIINGDKETGVTTFLLSHEIDTGAILFYEKIAITDNDNVGTIHDELMTIGAQLVLKTVDSLASGNYTPIEQDSLNVCSLNAAPKIFKEDCKIDWNNSAEKIRNLIRGLSPYPAAWSSVVDAKGKELSMKIYTAHIDESCAGNKIGSILTDGKTFFKVATTDKWLSLEDVHLAGKKRLNITEFLRGMQHADELTLL